MKSGREIDLKEYYSFRLKRKLLTPILAVSGLLVISLFILVLYIHTGTNRLNNSLLIMQENAVLKDKIALLNTEIDSIMTKLELMERWEDEIRSKENYRKINQEVRKMGVGGLPQIDSELLLSEPEFQVEYNLLTTRLIQLRSKAYFDYNTHLELYEDINLRDELYRSTPSIYPTFGRLSEGYGYRTHPITGKRDFHTGLDISNKRGTPIYATADGEIWQVGRKPKLGKYIKIKHKFGFMTVYGHLNKYFVRKGDQITKGSIIGEMGSTGKSTGSHLHYEVIRYKRHRNPISYLVQERRDITIKS